MGAMGQALLQGFTSVRGGAPNGGAGVVLPQNIAVLSRGTALRLAAKTILGTGKLLYESGAHPACIKDAVCSPCGTSIEGIAALEVRGFRAALIEAVTAANSKFDKLDI